MCMPALEDTRMFVKAFEGLEGVLMGFYKKRFIDISKLGLIDPIIKSAQTQQLKVLSGSLDLKIQRIMFSGFRNIENIGIVLKEKLATAPQRHENPTTVALALDLIPNLIGLSWYLDKFIHTDQVDFSEVGQLSRNLYRKSNALGFSRDDKIQLAEAGITADEIKSFVKSLNDKIALELEEGGPADEDTDRNLSTS